MPSAGTRTYQLMCRDPTFDPYGKDRQSSQGKLNMKLIYEASPFTRDSVNFRAASLNKFNYFLCSNKMTLSKEKKKGKDSTAPIFIVACFCKSADGGQNPSANFWRGWRSTMSSLFALRRRIRDKSEHEEMRPRLENEIEDIKFRLNRGSDLGRFDQFWDDDLLSFFDVSIIMKITINIIPSN